MAAQVTNNFGVYWIRQAMHRYVLTGNYLLIRRPVKWPSIAGYAPIGSTVCESRHITHVKCLLCEATCEASWVKVYCTRWLGTITY
jgi:hypothetical protein